MHRPAPLPCLDFSRRSPAAQTLSMNLSGRPRNPTRCGSKMAIGGGWFRPRKFLWTGWPAPCMRIHAISISQLVLNEIARAPGDPGTGGPIHSLRPGNSFARRFRAASSADAVANQRLPARPQRAGRTCFFWAVPHERAPASAAGRLRGYALAMPDLTHRPAASRRPGALNSPFTELLQRDGWGPATVPSGIGGNYENASTNRTRRRQ